MLLSADSCPPGAVKLTAPPPSEPSPRCEIPPNPTQMHRWARDASLDVQIQLRMCSSAGDAGRGPLLRLGPASSLPHAASSRRALRVWRGQTGWLARARASRLSNRPSVTADGPGTEKGNGAPCLHRFLSVALPAQISLVPAIFFFCRASASRSGLRACQGSSAWRERLARDTEEGSAWPRGASKRIGPSMRERGWALARRICRPIRALGLALYWLSTGPVASSAGCRGGQVMFLTVPKSRCAYVSWSN